MIELENVAWGADPAISKEWIGVRIMQGQELEAFLKVVEGCPELKAKSD